MQDLHIWCGGGGIRSGIIFLPSQENFRDLDSRPRVLARHPLRLSIPTISAKKTKGKTGIKAGFSFCCGDGGNWTHVQKVNAHASTKSSLFICLSRLAWNKQNAKRAEFLCFGCTTKRCTTYFENITPVPTYRTLAGRTSLRLARKRKRGSSPCMAKQFPWLLP